MYVSRFTPSLSCPLSHPHEPAVQKVTVTGPFYKLKLPDEHRFQPRLTVTYLAPGSPLAVFFLAFVARLTGGLRGAGLRRATPRLRSRRSSSSFFSGAVMTLGNFSGRSATSARSLAIHSSDWAAG